MAPTTAWTECQRFTETFKTVGTHEIKVDILLPPNIQPGIHPLIIAFHGGYLIVGARDLYGAMAAWMPAYATTTSAIIVSPDYRLFPSASTADILSDLESLWQWVQKELTGILSKHAPGYEVDLKKILVEGGSAGGFCAAQLALTHPDAIRAAILVYPMLDCINSFFSVEKMKEAGLKSTFTGQALDDEIERVRQAGPVSVRYDESFGFSMSLLEGERFGEMFGTNEEHNPVHMVKGLTKFLPRMWILHGKEDVGVPPQCSIEFAEVVKKSSVRSELILDIIDDEPSHHGFDTTWTMNDEKLTKRLDWINEAWLK